MSLSLGFFQNRRFVSGGLFAALMICAAPFAHGDDAETTVRLKYIKPSSIVRLMLQNEGKFADVPTRKINLSQPTPFLRLPEGIAAMTPDDAAKRLSLRGETQSVARLRKMAELLDVPTPKMRLKAQIIRYTRRGDAKKETAEIVGVADRPVNQEELCEINAVDNDNILTLQITPHICNPKNATLDARFVVTQSQRDRLYPSQSESATQGKRMTQKGEKIVLTALKGGVSYRWVKGSEKNLVREDIRYVVEVTTEAP